MSLTFYYGAGSPYAWRVWLALEHKSLEYAFKLMSFSDGDLKTPKFAALNPRRKVPVLVDARGGDAFSLYESAAILEYLDDAYPDSGLPLFPGDARARARVRRMVCEADNYVVPALDRLVARTLFTPEANWNGEKIAAARDELALECAVWAQQLRGDFLAGPLSAADFTLYPMLALALRCEKKRPDLAFARAIPAPLGSWMRRVEALPCCAKTWPAHWK